MDRISAGIKLADTVHMIWAVVVPFLICGDTETAHSGLEVMFLESSVSMVPSSLTSYGFESK